MYNVKFSIDKEQMIFIVKKAVLFRYTIVKDSGDEIVVGTPPSYLTTVTIKAQTVEFQGNVAVSNSCSAVIKKELAKYEAKQRRLQNKAEKEAKEKAEVKDPDVAERLELAVLLEKYKQLLDSGAISEEDYEKRKQEILQMMEFEKKEEEQPLSEAKEEPKEEVTAVAEPVQQTNNEAPAQAVPVKEKKAKCPTHYKVFAIIFAVLMLAAGAALIVFYFLLKKISTTGAEGGFENANGLGVLEQLIKKAIQMDTGLTNTFFKDKFTVMGLISGGIAGVAAILGSILTLFSIKPKEGGKVVINAITLILGGGAVINLLLNKTTDVIFLAVSGGTAFLAFVLIVLAFINPKEK